MTVKNCIDCAFMMSLLNM